ncbi:multi-sensor hybrid histidine kinase [Maridesulfovibrio salexigens DSM 2638]|uniref:Sensory/regulatory protein RpfC n=2 Tax=Maridesulfovibrio salexigens TaxID=880 RepID=C6BZW5_MARSD|nr:multi-sensor hybrid histidine kinase [Maridesulfovibrio salexigens DSM 2638]
MDAEKNIKVLLDANTQSILLLENDGTVIHVNRIVADILKTTPESLTGKNIFDYLPPELAAYRKHMFDNVVKSGEPIKFQDTREGRIILHSHYPIIENDKVSRVAIYAEDITEVINKERELAHSKHLQSVLYEIICQFNSAKDLNELMQSIHEIMLKELKAKNFFIALIDQEQEELVFTYCVDEGISEYPPIQNIFDPDNNRISLLPIKNNEIVQLTRQEIIKSVEHGSLEVMGRIPEIWIGVPMRVRNTPIGVLVIQDYENSDIFCEEDIQLFSACSHQIALAIERKKYDLAIRESEEQYRALFENNHSVMLIINPQTGKILDANTAATEFYGYSHTELQAKNIFDINVLSRAEVISNMSEAHKADRTNFIFQHRCKNGDIKDVEVFSGPFNHNGKTLLISIIHDITKRLKNEKELSAAKESAIRANKTKDEFLANISHEIRTPLNGVMGMLQVMNSAKLNQEHRNCISVALQSSRNLLRVLDDILDLSKVEMGTLDLFEDKFSLNKLLEESINLFKPQAEKKEVDLSYSIFPETESYYFGDEGRIRQILFNLIGNSIKFTDHGEIRVEARAGPGTCQDKNNLHFTVSDTGIGIPEDYQERIFDSFTQVDGSLSRRYKGAGLGLAIVKRLIELMEGSIKIESSLHHGTTISFTISLRIADPPEPNQNKKSDSMIETPILHILLVEDEPVNRMMARKLLERMGHKVTCAENGAHCLEILSEGVFDTILMDIQMPIMDGLEATRTIRTSNSFINVRDIPIIALSAHANKESRYSALEAGVNGYLCKPFEMKDLEKIIAGTAHRD